MRLQRKLDEQLALTFNQLLTLRIIHVRESDLGPRALILTQGFNALLALAKWPYKTVSMDSQSSFSEYLVLIYMFVLALQIDEVLEFISGQDGLEAQSTA